MAFHSASSNLVASDTNGSVTDIFIRDRGPADSAPPTVTGSPDRAANTNGWYDAPVAIDWTSVDPDPSSGTPADPPNTNANNEGTHTSVSDESCDPANNCATGELELSIDLSDPGVECETPPTFTLNQAGATVSATVTDAVSGPEASPVTESADTSGLGSGSVDITGTDLAGRSTTVSCSYEVIETTPPNVTGTPDRAPNGNGWYKAPVVDRLDVGRSGPRAREHRAIRRTPTPTPRVRTTYTSDSELRSGRQLCDRGGPAFDRPVGSHRDVQHGVVHGQPTRCDGERERERHGLRT